MTDSEKINSQVAKKSKRFLSLEHLAADKHLSLYKIWGGYFLTDNKIDGFRKELQYLDEIEDFLKRRTDE